MPRRVDATSYTLIGLLAAVASCAEPDPPRAEPDPAQEPSCDPSASPFGAGQGTPQSPYLLCSVEHLRAMGQPSAQERAFKLADNLDLSGQAWTPLPFIYGSLDGGGYTLKNLTYEGGDRPVDGALATQMAGAFLSNLRVDGLRVTSRSRAIGLIGMLEVERVSQLHVTRGDVATTDPDQGGNGTSAAGISTSYYGQLEDVSFEGEVRSVTGVGAAHNALIFGTLGGQAKGLRGLGAVHSARAQSTGGLVGRLQGKLEGCRFEGTISSDGDVVGGVAGSLEQSAELSDCQVNAQIQGAEDVGGLVGVMAGSMAQGQPVQSQLRRSHMRGQLQGTLYAGGLVGHLRGGGVIEHASFQGRVSAPRAGGAVGMFKPTQGSPQLGQLDFIWTRAELDSPAMADGNLGALVHFEGEPAQPEWTLIWDQDLWPRSGFKTQPPTVRGLTQAQLLQASSWEGWPTDIWRIQDGELPSLRGGSP